jgi:hypothetical protein
VLARDLSHAGVELDAQHRQAAVQQLARDLAGPAADVEYPPRLQRGELVEELGRGRRAVPVVEAGDRAERLGPPAITEQLSQGPG